MNVAVVAPTMREAVEVAARLGMTKTALPLAAESSPLLGHRFTAAVIVRQTILKDPDWWQTLLSRTQGPVFTLDQWADT